MLCIRPLEPRDIPACLELYNYYIENTTITFEEEPLDREAFAERARRIQAAYPYLVAEENGVVVGYAYLDAYNERSAYRYTADLSIYLAHDCLSRGVGTRLLAAVEDAGRQMGLHSLVAIITEENTRSLRFHAKHGYREVGRLYKSGLKLGRWLDVAFCQKMLCPEEGADGASAKNSRPLQRAAGKVVFMDRDSNENQREDER